MSPSLKRILTGTVVAAAAGALVFSSFTPALAEQPSTSTTDVGTSEYQYGNGYYIQNNTLSTLHLQTTAQEGNYSYRDGRADIYHGLGFMEDPPGQILPGQKAYFEVRMNLPTTFLPKDEAPITDDTKLVYSVGNSTKTINFDANLSFTFSPIYRGFFKFTNKVDHSQCSAENKVASCDTTASPGPGRGSQTAFTVNPTDAGAAAPSGGSTPQQVTSPDADATAASVVQYGNGYYIQNNTNHVLKLASTTQSGNYSYKNKYGWALGNYHGSGWLTDPPKEINPGEKAYFEVRMNLPSNYLGNQYGGGYTDNSTVRYTVGDTARTVTFNADLGLTFEQQREGEFKFVFSHNGDHSQCSVEGGSRDACVTTPSEGRGTQTTFMLDGAF